jgi:hypothetical protein
LTVARQVATSASCATCLEPDYSAAPEVFRPNSLRWVKGSPYRPYVGGGDQQQGLSLVHTSSHSLVKPHRQSKGCALWDVATDPAFEDIPHPPLSKRDDPWKPDYRQTEHYSAVPTRRYHVHHLRYHSSKPPVPIPVPFYHNQLLRLIASLLTHDFTSPLVAKYHSPYLTLFSACPGRSRSFQAVEFSVVSLVMSWLRTRL